MINKFESIGVIAAIGRNVYSWRPKVSVIIPAYNVAEFIDETLRSVKAQKYRDLEVIVINDGSPDTREFERELKPHLEDIIYLKVNGSSIGAGAARNEAIKHARGELIAFLDGDDVWLPDFLASQVAFLGKGYDMVYSDAAMFGLKSAYRRSFMETSPSTGEVDPLALLENRCNVITSGTLATKDALVAAGLFESERNRGHDFHLWLRMAKNGARIGYQKKILLKYRVRIDSLSGDAVSRVEREIDVYSRVRNTIGLTPQELAAVDRQIRTNEADLHLEHGKAFLLNEDFANAYEAFAESYRLRPSLKIKLVTLAARFFPRSLLKQFRSARGSDLGLIQPRPIR